MTVTELYHALRERIPAALACEWDNDGDMCIPLPDRAARRALVVLDITDDAIRHAAQGNFDVILSHHPLIFRGIKHMSCDQLVSRRVITLCREGIAALSFHTALDALPGGINDALAAALSLCDVVPFGTEEHPIGRIGTLSAPMQGEAFARLVADRLGCCAVTAGNPDVVAHRVAVLGGSGKEDVPAALRAGADTFVTGECGYHEMLDAAAMGLNVITAGHFHTEQVALTLLTALLHELCPALYVEALPTDRMRTVLATACRC